MEAKETRAVFVVEDDKNCRETLCMALEIYGYSIQAVESGEEGLQVLFSSDCKPPACILLDFLLPKMSGQEFIHKLKNECTNAEIKNIPIVILTAASHEVYYNVPEGVEILEKPFELEELMNKVGHYCVKH